MKICELEQNNFNRYEDNDGRMWSFDARGNLRSEDTNDDITAFHTWSAIQKMEFYKVIDWKTVAVDTPIYVRENPSDEWQERHFANFKDGKIYVFSHGMTSWTSHAQHVVDYKYAKLS